MTNELMIMDDTIISVSILPSIISLASFSGMACNIHDEVLAYIQLQRWGAAH